MNRGFSYYFTSGMSSARHALKGESFSKRFSLFLYFTMSLLGRLFFFTRPIFAIADINLATMVRECKSFSFAKIFQNTTDGNRYKNLLLFYFIQDCILLTGLILIMLPAIILWPVITLSSLDPSGIYYFALFWVAVLVSAVLFGVFIGFAIRILMTYLPVGYIAANNRDLDISDYLFNAKKAMQGLKWTYFLVEFVYGLILGAIAGVVVATVTCLFIFSETYLGVTLAIITILLTLFIFIYFLQIFVLGSHESTYLIHKYSVSLEKVTVVSENLDDTEGLKTVLDENDSYKINTTNNTELEN